MPPSLRVALLQYIQTGDLAVLAAAAELSPAEATELSRRLTDLYTEGRAWRRRYAYAALIGLTSRGLGANATPATYAAAAWAQADAMMAIDTLVPLP